MKSRTWTAMCGAAVLALAGAAQAAGDDGEMGGPAPAAKAAPAEDVLVLKDGTEVHGRIASEDETAYAVKVGGSLRVVEKSAVSEVKRGAPAPAPEAGAPPVAKPGDAPAGDPKEARKEKRREKRREDGAPAPGDAMGPAAPPAPLTDDARAWARTCVERLQSADPAIQRSAAEALRALGPSVLPLLREAREAADDAGKQRLERVAGMIEKGAAPGAPGQEKSRDKAGTPPGKAGQPGAPARGAGILERVKTDLALDDAQSRTVGMALLNLGRETREVFEDARDGLITYEDARTKVSGLRGKLRDDLKATLSADQLTKLDAILDEMGRRMAGPGAPKKDAPPAPKPDAPKPDKPV